MMTDFLKALGDQGLLSQTAIDDAEADTSFGEDGNWHDADTIQQGGETYRLAGYNAREVRNPKTDTSDQVGGRAQTAMLAKLAREKGFTDLRWDGKYGAHGRKIAELYDARGNKWSEELDANNIIDPNAYEQGNAERRNFGLLARMAREAGGEGNDWDKAADYIEQAIDDSTVTGGGLKVVAPNEAALSANKDVYLSNTTAFRKNDRDLNNRAYNPMSEAWETGLRGVAEGGAGMLELIGHQTGWAELENWAEGAKEDQQYKISQQPRFITEYTEVDDIGSAIEYVGNLAAMSLPYMALSIGGALAAPATGGLSLTAPASVYGGQVWNEMGDTDETEKNPALAIGAGISMAVLDRLGIAGIANAGLLSSSGRQAIIKQVAAREGIPEELAARKVWEATRLEAAKLTGDATTFAKQQLGAANIGKQFLKSALIGSASEGLTEAGQEAIASIAAYAGSEENLAKGWDWNDFNERITNAVVGGATLGGAFSVPGTAYDVGQWTDVAYRTAPSDTALIAEQNLWAEQEVADNGRVRSNQDIIKEATEAGLARGEAVDITARADRSEPGDWYKSFEGLLEAAPALWRGATRHIYKERLQQSSPALRKLASLFGGNLYQTFSGANFEAFKHLQLAEYKTILSSPTKITESFGFKTDNKGQQQASDLVYGAWEKASKRDNGTANWDSLVGTEYEAQIPNLKALDKQLQQFTNKLYQDQSTRDPELGFTTDYAYKHRSLNKEQIEKRKQEFINDLVADFKVEPAQARQMADDILDIDAVSDLDEAFSVVEKGGFKPSSHKARTLKLSEHPNFAAKWLDNNLFNNLSKSAKSAARYVAYQDYVGPDNSVINELLNQAEQELIDSGVAPAIAGKEVDKIARGMKDYLDAESGNYKRPTTAFGKGARAVQRNLMLYTTLIGLPLATVSSLVEFAMVYRGIDKPRIKELSDIAAVESKAMFANMLKTVDDHQGTHGRRELDRLGFFSWDVGAATVTGVQDTKYGQQHMMQRFFSAIGLTQWTDYTRALRAAMATDYLADKLQVYADADTSALTNEDVEARDALRNLGINVEDIVDLYRAAETRQLSEEENAQLDDAMRTATFNFVNDAVVLPQAANRPLFYQDPRFQLFTQFHGFISTFQANHLPKMYRSLFKGQTPSIKYNAFATMATMIMLGFLSQYIKDLLKYGQATEYLDTPKKIQRAIGASGLMGTTERLLNVVNPLYESRYNNSIEWAADTLLGESAGLSTAARLGDAAGSVFDGNTSRTAHKLSKLTPLVGPVGPRLLETGESAIEWLEE